MGGLEDISKCQHLRGTFACEQCKEWLARVRKERDEAFAAGRRAGIEEAAKVAHDSLWAWKAIYRKSRADYVADEIRALLAKEPKL